MAVVWLIEIKTYVKEKVKATEGRQWEAVNRMRTDNSMTTSGKGQKANNCLQNNAQKIKDCSIRITLKTGGDLMCSGDCKRTHPRFADWGVPETVSSFCFTSCHPSCYSCYKSCNKSWSKITTHRTYPWSLVTQIFRSG